jgi:lysophospholipase L1-like esterase
MKARTIRSPRSHAVPAGEKMMDTIRPHDLNVPVPPPFRRRLVWRIVRWSLVAALAIELALVVGFGLGDPPLVQRDAEIGYLNRANQNMRRFGNRVTVNRFHQRSDPVDDVPPTGTHRVLCVGDSVTWGGVLTDQKLTYPELLAENLRRLDPARPVEVLNASAGGWAIGNEAAYLRKFGTFGSRWVVLQIGSHDLFQATAVFPSGDPNFPVHKPWCATAELIERYAWPKVTKLFTQSPLELPPADEFAANMERFRASVALAKAGGAGVVILHTPDRDEVSPLSGPWPTYYDEHRAKFLAICQAEGVTVVNLIQQWRAGPRDPGEYFRDRVHPNELGNKAIADALDLHVR